VNSFRFPGRLNIITYRVEIPQSTFEVHNELEERPDLEDNKSTEQSARVSLNEDAVDVIRKLAHSKSMALKRASSIEHKVKPSSFPRAAAMGASESHMSAPGLQILVATTPPPSYRPAKNKRGSMVHPDAIAMIHRLSQQDG
jgi:hypothetical protein